MIAATEVTLMFLHSPTHNSPTHMCWVCGKAVDIKNCKTDEHGSAVHELCYAAKIGLANASITRRKTILRRSA